MRLLAALILLSTLAIYTPVLEAGFVYEDANWRGQVSAVHQAGVTRWPGRALTQATYAAQDGSSARQFHAVNVLIHLAVGVSVAVLAWRLGVTPVGALIAGAMFLWHPLNSQAVAYLSARSDLLMTLAIVLAVLVAGTSWHWRVRGLLVLLLSAAAMQSKELGLVSLLAVVWTYAPHRGLVVAGLAGTVFLLIWPALSVWLPFIAWGEWLSLVGAAAAGIWRVVGLAVIPVGLSIDPDPWAVPVVLRAVAVVALVVSAAWALRSEGRAAWAWGWVLVALLPRVVVPTYEPVHDHHAYLAMVGISVWVGSVTEGVFA